MQNNKSNEQSNYFCAGRQDVDKACRVTCTSPRLLCWAIIITRGGLEPRRAGPGLSLVVSTAYPIISRCCVLPHGTVHPCASTHDDVLSLTQHRNWNVTRNQTICHIIIFGGVPHYNVNDRRSLEVRHKRKRQFNSLRCEITFSLKPLCSSVSYYDIHFS